MSTPRQSKRCADDDTTRALISSPPQPGRDPRRRRRRRTRHARADAGDEEEEPVAPRRRSDGPVPGARIAAAAPPPGVSDGLCAPGRSPSAAALTNPNPREEAKVVVSVTVEGSVGPVKAMVRLGASVGEAIAAVVERYAREGRSPRLDPAAAEGFQLHHSHFSLESLNKSDKIGDVGGRNFYLHKNYSSNGLYLQSENPDGSSICSEITQGHGQLSSTPYNFQVLTIVIKKLDKIGRRTKRIWRFITCNNCT